MSFPRCPTHRRAMYVEDSDRAYRQTLWFCPERGCHERSCTGPSDHDIYRREHPSTAPRRVRPLSEQLEGEWL